MMLHKGVADIVIVDNIKIEALHEEMKLYYQRARIASMGGESNNYRFT